MLVRKIKEQYFTKELKHWEIFKISHCYFPENEIFNFDERSIETPLFFPGEMCFRSRAITREETAAGTNSNSARGGLEAASTCGEIERGARD